MVPRGSETIDRDRRLRERSGVVLDRVPGCERELRALRELADGAGLRPTIETTVELTNEGFREAFRRLHSRRVRGRW